ncbi:two pore domain potassium channel family protein [Halobacillus litoralis]|uniref:Two pore domain potassium channel family protein n=1 Tax=Halobacillus litoralis TaxID=45668 RepID=A0A845DZ87_9BACI|nr:MULTISPECIES: potassium channel family protein [Halobacillus]MYL18764.1 two pore domain potassium channel family protein [Halobacillus litoralis]MYL31493.1 two pore domain potassium channel family protein [Halobacillus halophilus]MYL39202.1 two pore domain potassium channel family protein [Halobacillus litoralis]
MISFLLTLKRLLTALFRSMKEPVFRSLLTTLAFILLSGTLFYKGVEDWTYLDAFYYAFSSLIPTSGNTGLVPQEDLSKWFTMIYLFVGMGVMAMVLIKVGLAVADFEKHDENQTQRRKTL